MTDLLALGAPYRETFLLLLVRLGGLMVSAPVLGHRAIPLPHRAGLALLLALVVTPAVTPVPAATGPLALALAVAGELLAGLAIGFVASLVLAAVHGAAEVVAIQMGLGVAATYDPSLGQQSTPLARLEEYLALLLLLATNGHHVLIQAVAASFRRLEPGALALATVHPGVLAGLGGKVFRASLELAAPVIGVLFVVNFALGLLTRVAPQMNVFSVGLPVAVAAGFVALLETVPYGIAVVTRLLGELGTDLSTVLAGAGRGL